MSEKRAMITRIHVDNYKCLGNFDLEFDELTVLLGDNGAGKSAVFEVIRMLRDFIGGDGRVGNLFSIQDLTHWTRKDRQTFELEIGSGEGNDGNDRFRFLYRLVIEHNRNSREVRVQEERLTYNGRPLFAFDEGAAQLYHDDHSEGPSLKLDWTRSGLGSVGESGDNWRLIYFREAISRIVVLNLEPRRMESGSDEEADRLLESGENFAAWIRGRMLDDIELFGKAVKELKTVLLGFQGLKMSQKSGDYRALQATFASDDDEYLYLLEKLSDGQRMLIALYMVLFTHRSDCTLFIDEADNYVALPEIQPWLQQLDECGDSLPQVVLISHHPEVMNYCGEDALWLWREPEDYTRVVTAAEIPNDTGLSNAELYAQRSIPPRSSS